MALSRIRSASSVPHVFEVFLEVAASRNGVSEDPFVLQMYPPTYKEKGRLKEVPRFVFPCNMPASTVQNFSFVMVNADAVRSFGFCRSAPNADTALVMISSLPWHEAFYKLLNHAAELTLSSDAGELERFLDACYNAQVPLGGAPFHVSWNVPPSPGDVPSPLSSPRKRDFSCQTPTAHALPSIPENRNLTEYFNAAGIHNMLVVFASMLHERRIIITSKRISNLSACVQAANSLIYPMDWQHIYIPILPRHLADYLAAPMPFLIGVPAPIMAESVKQHELSEVVVLDADEQVVHSPFDDLAALPSDVASNLKRSLNRPKDLVGESIARAFLQALVHLIGGYREALKQRQGGKIELDEQKFIESRPPTMQPFLEQMLQLQIFRQFCEERLAMLNDRRGISDEFEMEVVRFQERENLNSARGVRLRAQAANIGSTVKKESGHIVKTIKQKANPAMKSAVKSVRTGGRGIQHRGKTVYRDVRSKMKNSSSNLDVNGLHGGTLSGDGFSSSSAPSSPVLKHRTMSTSSASSSNGSNSFVVGGSGGASKNGSNSSSAMATPVGTGGGGAALRSHAAEAQVNFGRVLKYERFDPATASPPEKSAPSPEILMEGPKPLDLDLMTDLKDVIFSSAPPANRHLKPPLKRMDAAPVPYENLKDSFEVEVAANGENGDSVVGEAAVMTEDPFRTDHIDVQKLANSQPPPSSSAMADLISLDNGSRPPAEVIFDPLLQRSNNSNHINNVGLPKPPSTSTLPQLAELYGGGGGGPKRPLERSAAATANNGGKNPFTAMIAENAFAATTNMTNPAVQMRNVTPQPYQPPRPFTSAASAMNRTSTDDLLQEYGLDFSKLTTTATRPATLPTNHTAAAVPGLLFPTASATAPAGSGQGNLDPFADLDPLSAVRAATPNPSGLTGATAVPRPASASPVPPTAIPVAPPRSKRPSLQQNWTTFD